MTKITPADNPANLFDRLALRHHREKTARNSAAYYSGYDFLIKEVADRLYDKFLDIKRDFHHILDLGCHGGELGHLLKNNLKDKILINQDLSYEFLKHIDGVCLQADEELLPYRAKSLDLILSNLSLHFVNDLPGCLAQIMQCLKPDGLFMAAVFGGETLTELRTSLMQAEVNIRGGTSPRISPFMDGRDAGALLQRAGFALPVVDTDRITVTYENAFKLMQDLKGMGEANILTKRMRGLTTPRVMMECAKIYQEKFTDHRGRITVTFDVIYMMGWSPHESQQQPLKPGQGKVNLNDMFGEKER